MIEKNNRQPDIERELRPVEYDLLSAIAGADPASDLSQRSLSLRFGLSLGRINKALKLLRESGYLDERDGLTEKAAELFERRKPQRAVILAAGFGMRMVPINQQAPKGLLMIRGETLIERQIRQLQEAGISEISVVVGYMKEQYEYLIDSYGVKLIVNRDYDRGNNLLSLYSALKSKKNGLHNCYIVPCDLWCASNPFRGRELYSWYSVADETDPDSDVRVNRKGELVRVAAGRHLKAEPGNRMIGIAYLTDPDNGEVAERVREMAAQRRYKDMFWEEALYAREDRMQVWARVLPAADMIEINTYEQLREMDAGSAQLQTDSIRTICDALSCQPEEITQIEVLKKGMTNRSFIFRVRGKKYIMRIPGEGTEQLIDRRGEAAVYSLLKGKGISDDVIYIDPDTGYKITAFIENARVCDPSDPEDVRRAMARLRDFHGMRLETERSFDLFGQIDFYETLRGSEPSVFRDYDAVKEHVMSLRPFVESGRGAGARTLCHIDAVQDNFLFAGDDLYLIDWEYAGMQDPNLDIAMFGIYAMYGPDEMDRLIDSYYTEGCSFDTRTRIYCYIAAAGLLWSNWSEYKRTLGVEFGEYCMAQYRYAKEYYRIAAERLSQTVE